MSKNYDVMGISKPMLAGRCTDTSKLTYPLLATPKLDGIRCLTIAGEDGKVRAVSRTFKDIPNAHINSLVSALEVGLDGELMCDDSTFSEITGNVMREDGEPDFYYAVFDYFSEKSYQERMADLKAWNAPKFVRKILPVEMKNEQDLLEYEQNCLASGYEGIMTRIPNGRYKCGRSTEREQLLLKIKRFVDNEAEIIEIIEKMTNDNVAEKDNFGRTKRSTALDGMVPANTLGAFRVRDVVTGTEFQIGSGFDDAFRKKVWANQSDYIGQILTYKSQEIGSKDAPRFPVFLHLRDKRDVDIPKSKQKKLND